ncbi:hypothetical protein PAMP_003967 [Pampus punctatissimus]
MRWEAEKASHFFLSPRRSLQTHRHAPKWRLRHKLECEERKTRQSLGDAYPTPHYRLITDHQD